MPHVGSLEVLNAALAAADARDDARHISGRAETIGDAAARELPLLTPLPAEPFDVSLRLLCRFDAKGPNLCPTVLLLGAGSLRRPPSQGPAGRHQSHCL